MLQWLGFSTSFCDMIYAVLHSARLLVLINGSPCEYFACSRGVRKGDPLSLLLFCLAEVALSRWLDCEVTYGRLIQIPRAPRYLLYANDIIIFAKATTGNIQRFLSGQLYNPSKSKVYFGSAVTRRVRYFMLNTTGITMGSLPFSYLEVPIFRGAARTYHWLLCLTLSSVNSVSGRGTYSLWQVINPRSLLKKIETAMKNFLWTSDISRWNTSCSVSWARCCSPLEEGGMGVRSIHIANDFFICKLAWYILCNRSSDISLLHDRYIFIRGIS
ncbi:hypothetical protein ACS0TY_027086 [Phlomoides rotata]